MVAKRRLIPSEHDEQKAVVQWFQSYARTKGIDPRLLFSLPNAQILLGLCKSDKDRLKVLAYLKAEGLQPGVPDLFLAHYKKGDLYPTGQSGHYVQAVDFCGLFIELKRKGGKPSKDQLFMADLLRCAGFNVVIAYGFEEAQRAIRAYIET